ncbi:hypothetical protein B0H67DRAFT_648761 [Lasiosphaeris hirsuta]|uniref:Uncharacterized protein n=1 Tax=Lasiosphaeris hirsuta TaxID=260670 RepID=A0AA39ZVH5_9PEZI|nr:hypothetical protein B0H67DRAFT_648761 [Lasiosphaeris hirsuta]
MAVILCCVPLRTWVALPVGAEPVAMLMLLFAPAPVAAQATAKPIGYLNACAFQVILCGGVVSITGVTEDQRDALGRRVNRSLSEAEQWNSIWDILHPGIPRPGSPYVANKIEEAIDVVFSCLRDQRSTLMQELKANLGNERFDPLLLPVASELVEDLLGRVRKKLLVPASADSEQTSVTTSWDC